MQRLQKKTLWYLVSIFTFTCLPSISAAKDTLYKVSHSTNDNVFAVEFVSCSEHVKPINLIVDVSSIDFEKVVNYDPCSKYIAKTNKRQSQAFVSVRNKDEIILHILDIRRGIVQGVSPEIRSVLIFVGGLMAATIGRILSIVLDPIYHTIRIMMKYRATRRFFYTNSDKFDKGLQVSEDLQKVANGDYLTNFLLTEKRRNKIQVLLNQIDEWKSGQITPDELRKKLQS